MSDFKVGIIDLQQRFQEEKAELLKIVHQTLESGHLVLTPEVQAFEQAAARYAGVKHCVGLNSGTDALIIGMKVLGIGPGDEVITPPNSFVASTGAIVAVGATPVYADVMADQNINPELVEKCITPKTKAIMPVHWTGRIADMNAIMAIAKRHNLLVVEDAAQSMGAYYHGQHGGTWGNVAAFSTHPLKNLNAIGDGGFLFTNNDETDAAVRLYRNHGLKDRDTCVSYGVNSRLDVIHALVLKYRLTRLAEVIEKRRHNANLYRESIKTDQVVIPADQPHEKNAYVMFITQCERRDQLQKHLGEKGIQALVYYGIPLHLQPAAKSLGYKKGNFPMAEQQAERVLALPHHQYLRAEQIQYVAETINAFYGA